MKGVQMIILVVDEKFVSMGKRSHRAHLYKAIGKHLRWKWIVWRIWKHESLVLKDLHLKGFWPDGIYSPPTEEAMLWDLKQVTQRKMKTLSSLNLLWNKTHLIFIRHWFRQKPLGSIWSGSMLRWSREGAKILDKWKLSIGSQCLNLYNEFE